MQIRILLGTPSAFAYATARQASPGEDVELEKRMSRCNDLAEAVSASGE